MTSISIFNGFLPFVSDFRTAISALCFLVKIKPAYITCIREGMDSSSTESYKGLS